MGETETTALYEQNRKNGLSLGVDGNFVSVAKETANTHTSIQTDYIGSTFNASDSMSLKASRDVNITGSSINANNNLFVGAGRDINVLTGQSESTGSSTHSETKTGFELSADSNTASVFVGDDINGNTHTGSATTQISSNISAGENVTFDAGNDIAIEGSNIGAGMDISLSAINDISIVSAQESASQQSEQEHIRDGLTVSAHYNLGNTADAIGNIGEGDNAVSQASSVMQATDALNNAGPSGSAHLGRTTTTATNAMQQQTALASNILAGRNFKVNAGGDALFEGTNVNAGKDISVSAENITIIAAKNTQTSNQSSDYLQVGANLNASNGNASLTVGFSQSDSTHASTSSSTVASQFAAGNNMQLNARNDLTVEGADIAAENDLALIAGNDIAIKAHETQFDSASEDSHLSVNAGINFGANGVGVTANMAMGEGELDRTGTQYQNSHVQAGNSLTVISGNDTTIAGGNLAGSDVAMDIGGDLTVASVQNTGGVDGKRWDVSASITVGAGVTGSASVGYGETSGETAWVAQQSSIIGSNSVAIHTDGHTQIDGALIANIDEHGNDNGNLQLSTNTIGYSDIHDVDNETSSYLNVGFSSGDNTSTNQKESGNNYSVSGSHYDIDKEQTNLATIGTGNITVGGQNAESLEGLNRDTSVAQQVTKDDSTNINLYASTTAVDSLQNLAENPSEQLGQWQDNVTSVGDADAWEEVATNAETTVKIAGYVASGGSEAVEQINNTVARQNAVNAGIATYENAEATDEERQAAAENIVNNIVPWDESDPAQIDTRNQVAAAIGELAVTDPEKATKALVMLGQSSNNNLQSNFLPAIPVTLELLMFLGIGTAVTASTDEGQDALKNIARETENAIGNAAGYFEEVPPLTEHEVFGQTLEYPEDAAKMLEVGQAYQMADGSVVAMTENGMFKTGEGNSVLNGYSMVTTEQLGQQGGYIPTDQEPIAATPNPSSDFDSPTVYDNITPELPEGTDGYQSGETLTADTETVVQESSSEETIYFNKNAVDLTNGRDGHIIANHAYGAGKADKTEFPLEWDKNKIVEKVSDIATDPNLNMLSDSRGTPYVVGTRDGITVRVNFYPKGHKREGQIATAYPIKEIKGRGE
nr:hemagglutinin repeat-containing protein [Alteromonas ponticola]